MSAECSAETTPSGYKQTEVGVIPEDWNHRAFGYLYAETSRNGIYKTSEFHGRGTRIVNMGEMFGLEFISNQEMTHVELTDRELAASRLQNGDLLFGRRSVVPAGAGKCSLVVSPIEPITFESSIIRVRLDTEKAHSPFYYYFFASPIGRSTVGTIVSGTNIKGIRATELRELKVPIPTKAEQESIAEALFDTDTLIESLGQLIAKKRQIKQGAMQELLTGKRRLPGFEIKKGYKQTEIGMLPEDWELMRIGAIATIEGGFAFSSKNFLYDGKYQVVKMSNLYGGSLDLERSASYLNELNDQEKHYLLHHDDILITLTGTIGKRDYGYSYKINNEKNLLLNQRVCRLIVGQETIANYVAFQLKTPYFLDQFFNVAKGGTGNQTNVGTKDIEEIRIPAPSLLEQEAIATILSDMDSEITALEEKLSKARQIKQGMIQELLTGRIRLI